MIGRFVPIVRTYITVVAGVGRDGPAPVLHWSAVGAVLWVCGVTLLGYFLGAVPFVRDNIDGASSRSSKSCWSPSSCSRWPRS